MEYSQYQPGQDTERDEALAHLFVQTFRDSEGPEEGALIGKLVKDLLETVTEGDLHVYVAVEDTVITGSALFSRFTCGDGTNAFLMAPVAVHTDFQNRGIGQALILFALQDLRAIGVQLVMSYGDIRFYAKTGFVPVSEDLVPAPLTLSYPDGWIGQSFDGKDIQPIRGGTRCVAAIDDSTYW